MEFVEHIMLLLDTLFCDLQLQTHATGEMLPCVDATNKPRTPPIKTLLHSTTSGHRKTLSIIVIMINVSLRLLSIQLFNFN